MEPVEREISRDDLSVEEQKEVMMRSLDQTAGRIDRLIQSISGEDRCIQWVREILAIQADLYQLKVRLINDQLCLDSAQIREATDVEICEAQLSKLASLMKTVFA